MMKSKDYLPLIAIFLSLGTIGGLLWFNYHWGYEILTINNGISDLETKLHETNNRFDVVENQYTELLSQYEQILSEIEDLETQISEMGQMNDKLLEIEEELMELEDRYGEVQLSYEILLNSTGIYSVDDFSREITVPLKAGYKGFNETTIQFDAGYGIIMEAYVSLLTNGQYESSIDIELSWRRGDERGFLVGLGNAPAQTLKEVHVTAFCEIFDEDDDRLWVKVGAFIEELPSIRKDDLTIFSKQYNP